MRGILIQVRLDSTRLPNKALLKLKGVTLIEHALRSLKKVNAERYIVVTTEDSIGKLEPIITSEGWDFVVGPKEDVLKRFIMAIDQFGLTQIVRATGDNPLVSWELANILIDRHSQLGNDYSGFLNNPLGTGVEVVESKALKIAYNSTNLPYDREHVTPYLYNNREHFKVYQEDAPNPYILKGTSVTVDTKDDFIRIEKLYNQLYHKDTIAIESVIKWLKKEL